MIKTNVMIEFSIYGDCFNPSDITEKIGLIPTKEYLKGDSTKSRRNTYKETSWSIHTDYEESYDINDQLEKIMLLLNGKLDKLIEIKKEYNVKMLFMIVVIIENNETPAMYFRKPFIHFLSDIDAEVGFDLYVNL